MKLTDEQAGRIYSCIYTNTSYKTMPEDADWHEIEEYERRACKAKLEDKLPKILNLDNQLPATPDGCEDWEKVEDLTSVKVGDWVYLERKTRTGYAKNIYEVGEKHGDQIYSPDRQWRGWARYNSSRYDEFTCMVARKKVNHPDPGKHPVIKVIEADFPEDMEQGDQPLVYIYDTAEWFYEGFIPGMHEITTILAPSDITKWEIPTSWEVAE